MLGHALGGRAGAGEILGAAAGGEDGRPGDAALLSAGSMCFALGGATTEQVKHLAAAEAGPLAGLAVLPGLRALRPRPAAIAGRPRPLRRQRICRPRVQRGAPGTAQAMLPVIATVSYGGRARRIAWAGETVQIKDYGEARQITLFEHGKVALQILTSDFDACPAEILAWLKSRWREENFLKYASENYGIDKICDYLAGIEANTKITGNPARKQANAAVRQAEKALTAPERHLAVLLADPAIAPAAKNTRLIPAAQKKISAARKKLAAAAAARDKVPAKLPANAIDPEAKTALLRAGRRGLQMVLRLLARNAEHWLSPHLHPHIST